MDYSIFSKRYQSNNVKSKKNYNPNYNKKDKHIFVEKWFQERLNYNKSEITKTTETNKLPPGLTKKVNAIKFCTKCNEPSLNSNKKYCCSEFLCNYCSSFYRELYNRCYKCNSIIDKQLSDLYGDIGITIPPYEDFYYIA
jgi:formylmethanofuran dehydrogenase subunit E